VFNNKLVISDRKTSGTIRARRPFVCIIGGIQPGTFRRVLGREHLENGMAARMLLAWPPSRPTQWTDAEVSEGIQDAVSGVIDRLFTLETEVDDKDRPRPVLVWPTGPARTMFVQYYNKHAAEMVELSGDIKAAWSKLEEYAARIALVIHFSRWAANDPTLHDEHKVDEASMAAGIRITQWFKNEARRVYGMLFESDNDHDERQLLEWIGCKGGSVTAREVQQGRREFKKAHEAEEALTKLVKAGHGLWEPTPPGRRGQPTRRFVLSTVYGNALDQPKSSNTVDVDGQSVAKNEPETELASHGRTEISDSTECDHKNPEAWRHQDGKAHCPGCNKYMGRISEGKG
jgi:hypothetical protein